MSELNVNGLSVYLRDSGAALVKNLSFTLRGGSSLTLLGQSGCGKTMTCRAIMGLLEKKAFRTEGSVSFDGTELTSIAEKERKEVYGKRIAFIPQDPMTALNPSSRIGRQMDETLRLHCALGSAQRRERIISALNAAGLPDPQRIFRAYPYMLSGGMLQRVLIAIAMSTGAQLVIGDEPTTALDVVHRNSTVDAFLRLRDEGAAILFVTHDFAAAQRLGGEVLVMRSGEAVEQGETRRICLEAKCEYTKSLVRASALSQGHADKGRFIC